LACVKFWSNPIEKICHLYIHFPFCASKCHYCSFYSIGYNPDYYDSYIKSLRNEFDYYSDLYDFSELSTIYIGGGNPCINEELTANINKILLSKATSLDSIKEYTIEGNPISINKTIVRSLKDNYINRISLGIQSFTERALTFANRLYQTKDIVCNSLDILNESFSNISIDIINNLPESNVDYDIKELESVIINFENVRHISFYDLSIDEGTVFYNNRFINNKDLDKKRDRYEKKFIELISKYNFNRYEVSNFSQIGFESKHNIGYWKYKNFLGLGPSAHSLINNMRIENSADFGLYTSGGVNGKFEYKKNIQLSRIEQIEEYIMMGLRLVEGINIKEINSRFEIDLLKILESRIGKIFESKLLILDDNNRLKTTSAGMQMLNKILIDIFLVLEEKSIFS